MSSYVDVRKTKNDRENCLTITMALTIQKRRIHLHQNLASLIGPNLAGWRGSNVQILTIASSLISPL